MFEVKKQNRFKLLVPIMVLYCRISATIFEELATTGAAGQREAKLSMEYRGDQGKLQMCF